MGIGDNTEYGAWQYAAAALKIETYGKRLVAESGTRNISFLAQGTSIGASSNFVAPGNYPNQLDLRTATYTTWDNKTGYVGFEYTSRGRICYGWMHIKVEAGGVGYTVLDYAYNTKPNEPILAGIQTANVVLAPTSLTATVTNLEASLTWTNNATNATNVIIERAGSDDVYAEIVTLANTASTYTNTALTAGSTYKYRVRAKSGTDYSAYSNVATVTIPAASLCSAQGANSYEYISSIAVGSFVNTSGKETNGYADYTSKVITLTPNANTSITLTPGFTGSAYTEYWGVWIDYNKNNQFEESEKVVNNISSNGAVTASFTPASFTGTTRMRIVMKYNANPSSTCGNLGDGEIEDYTVSAGTSVPPNPATLTIPANLGNAGVYTSGFYASWATSTDATSYEVQLNTSSGWTLAGTSTTYYLWIPKQGTQTVYEFRVKAKNGNAFSDWSASHTIDLQSGSLGLPGSDINTAKTFTMYPNPASDVVNFTFENIDINKVKVSIYDSTGHLIATMHNTTVYSLKYLNKGVYIVVATDGKFVEKKKLLVE
ncbi:GEVED domain-containing protein [Flavobacterium ginsengisoli]|uniref:T9SS type A sorting domain-containing protein n=1 Tax=Flavobacterium ginsengisoli TaxID=871694 RepID=UPI002414E527|nr:GEVED domain-containing protein [Flavobacterium ginsengisoli]